MTERAIPTPAAIKERHVELVKAHLSHVKDVRENSLDEFRCLWDAFNVMYENMRPELVCTMKKEPSERDAAKYCASRLEYSEWITLFDKSKLEKLLSITPIFDERSWNREAKKNQVQYRNLAKYAKKPLTGNPDEDVAAYYALIDLLYVVRCNLYHGFKTPYGPRDNEVMEATVPLLRELVTKLATKFLEGYFAN